MKQHQGSLYGWAKRKVFTKQLADASNHLGALVEGAVHVLPC